MNSAKRFLVLALIPLSMMLPAMNKVAQEENSLEAYIVAYRYPDYSLKGFIASTIGDCLSVQSKATIIGKKLQEYPDKEKNEKFNGEIIEIVSKKYKNTPLNVARCVEIAAYLKTSGAQIWLRNRISSNAEFKAVALQRLYSCCFSDKNSADAEFLINVGTPVNESISSGVGALTTPLIKAAECSALKIVLALIEAKADVTAVDGDGKNALDNAQRYQDNLYRNQTDRTEVIELLQRQMLKAEFSKSLCKNPQLYVYLLPGDIQREVMHCINSHGS